MKSYYLTDTGKVRSHNEDNVVIVKNSNNEYLMAVADGMGGHSAGEIASSIAIEDLSKNFQKDFNKFEKVEAVNWLRMMVADINEQIFEHVERNPESKGMGTTLVCAIITEKYILFANVGDSSGFAMKDNKLYKVTYDHTLVNLLLKAGELTSEEAKGHPKKNVLMKALGANNPVDIDIFDCDLDVEAILLCSDGLTNMLDPLQIEKLLNEDEDIEDKVIRLIRKSNNRGGTDNISIAYLEMDKKVNNDN